MPAYRAGNLNCWGFHPVVAEAEKTHGSAARLYEAQAHHFFTPQLLVGVRAYSLHSILHDWADAEGVRIRKNLRPAVLYFRWCRCSQASR
ncbi:hypothetical protein PG994_015273 [Apiospora phragmitis]|uniref:O-methyltransferase domain-containing protein n=1 Tax=Apiospora phragmitis TaxID=2905665 RepID=A0ABR1SR35_9PEZI